MAHREPLIKEYMTCQPQTIGAGDSAEKARQFMTQIGVRHLPVTKGGALVGILSERELNLACGIESIDASQLLVIDVCSQNPCTVTPDTPLRTVAKIMADEHFGSMIVAERGKPVGIFTTSDACRALHDVLTAIVFGKGIEEVRGRCSYEY